VRRHESAARTDSKVGGEAVTATVTGPDQRHHALAGDLVRQVAGVAQPPKGVFAHLTAGTRPALYRPGFYQASVVLVDDGVAGAAGES
jgi:hypothetical protein